MIVTGNGGAPTCCSDTVGEGVAVGVADGEVESVPVTLSAVKRGEGGEADADEDVDCGRRGDIDSMRLGESDALADAEPDTTGDANADAEGRAVTLARAVVVGSTSARSSPSHDPKYSAPLGPIAETL